MDIAKPKETLAKSQEELAKEKEDEKKREVIAKLDINSIPALMPDHHLKGMQMLEDPNNDWRHTEFPDENKLKLAVKVWAQGFMFNDRIRMAVADKYIEAMMSHKRKRESVIAEMTRSPGPGEYPSMMGGESLVKKPGIFERIKRAF
jgi:hypothetical protein